MTTPTPPTPSQPDAPRELGDGAVESQPEVEGRREGLSSAPVAASPPTKHPAPAHGLEGDPTAWPPDEAF
jgi:hypothetical protein